MLFTFFCIIISSSSYFLFNFIPFNSNLNFLSFIIFNFSLLNLFSFIIISFFGLGDLYLLPYLPLLSFSLTPVTLVFISSFLFIFCDFKIVNNKFLSLFIFNLSLENLISSFFFVFVFFLKIISSAKFTLFFFESELPFIIKSLICLIFIKIVSSDFFIFLFLILDSSLITNDGIENFCFLSLNILSLSFWNFLISFLGVSLMNNEFTFLSGIMSSCSNFLFIIFIP